jgi:SPOR domain
MHHRRVSPGSASDIVARLMGQWLSEPLIRKKDQGERGVFYAAQVGPLARDEANQLCETLKSAGGSCYIQRN